MAKEDHCIHLHPCEKKYTETVPMGVWKSQSGVAFSC